MEFLLRDEARTTERRAPIVPKDAERLIKNGFKITVESSHKRIFSDEEYKAAGCKLVDADTWENAPAHTTILGLKELPDKPNKLINTFIHFAHVYKDQSGWQNEIQRFINGGGQLLDLEYLTINNRRTAAFGYWAGWMGAALAAWRLLAIWNNTSGPEVGVNSFDTRDDVTKILDNLSKQSLQNRKAIVVGAKGRSGKGATEALELSGFKVTEWDIEETRNLDKAALMEHDILVNCVLMTGPGLQLLSKDDLSNSNNRIKIISDVSCDPFSDYNPLPLYDAPTTWETPLLDLGNGVELTSIDNLPSMLPKEASEDFSSQLLKSLLNYPDGEEWQNARNKFQQIAARA